MEKYNDFMEDYKNYLYAIRNLSEGSVKMVYKTVKQFLEYLITFKFENRFNSVEEMDLNDIRTLSNQDIYSYIFYLAENDYKTTTRSAKIEYLRSFFDFLYKIKHRLFNQPFQKINTEKTDRGTACLVPLFEGGGGFLFLAIYFFKVISEFWLKIYRASL